MVITFKAFNFMKKLSLLFLFICLSLGINAQSFIGAWEGFAESESGERIRNVVIFSDGYQVSTWFNAEDGKFIKTNGGSWKLDGDMMTEVVEFDTDNPDRVGSEVNFKIYIKDKKMGIVGEKMEWNRIDDGTPGALKGAWLMSGRVRDGETQTRNTDGPRKTMKMLSGSRFQWIAYNTETRQFMGTGGGTYTTIDGKYTETIEFFSRDDTRVGMSLEFDYHLDEGNWHHKGFSSKGDPIYEIWSLRKR
jgi:hypothetical protein